MYYILPADPIMDNHGKISSNLPIEEYVSPYRNEDILASMETSTVYVLSTTSGAVSGQLLEIPERPPKPELASNIIVRNTSSMIDIRNTSIDPSKDPKEGNGPIVNSNKPEKYDSLTNCLRRSRSIWPGKLYRHDSTKYEYNSTTFTKIYNKSSLKLNTKTVK